MICINSNLFAFEQASESTAHVIYVLSTIDYVLIRSIAVAQEARLGRNINLVVINKHVCPKRW